MLVCEFDLPLGCGLGMSLAFIVHNCFLFIAGHPLYSPRAHHSSIRGKECGTERHQPMLFSMKVCRSERRVQLEGGFGTWVKS